MKSRATAPVLGVLSVAPSVFLWSWKLLLNSQWNKIYPWQWVVVAEYISQSEAKFEMSTMPFALNTPPQSVLLSSSLLDSRFNFHHFGACPSFLRPFPSNLRYSVPPSRSTSLSAGHIPATRQVMYLIDHLPRRLTIDTRKFSFLAVSAVFSEGPEEFAVSIDNPSNTLESGP